MFEKFVETLNQTGKVVGEKTKQGTDVVKANIKISSEERAVNELFFEIGKTYLTRLPKSRLPLRLSRSRYAGSRA